MFRPCVAPGISPSPLSPVIFPRVNPPSLMFHSIVINFRILFGAHPPFPLWPQSNTPHLFHVARGVGSLVPGPHAPGEVLLANVCDLEWYGSFTQ